MSAPKLSISVEPVESGKVVYLPLVAEASDKTAQIKIVLRLRITNNETKNVNVSGIQFSFPGSAAAPAAMQGIPLAMVEDGMTSASATIQPGKTATWSSGAVALDANTTISNAVYMNAPAPPKIAVNISCSGFSAPATVTFDLAAYTHPTADGGFLFIYSTGDLRDGEYVFTSAQHWANGGAWGTQIFAHDINVQAKDGGSWNRLLPGKKGDKNEDYRVWGKPVRAVADGVVADFFDGMENNTKLGAFPTPTPNPVDGNHFWIQHGDLFVRYAHLQKHSLPAELKKKGTSVKAGQMLGLAGNSGNASEPHTHIECEKGGIQDLLRPMPFRNAWAVDPNRISPPSPDGPWVRMNNSGVSKDEVAIWPESTWPTFRIPAAGISRDGDWANRYWISGDLASFEKTAQDLFDKQGKRLIYMATFKEHGQRLFAGISRAGDWANSFWISNDLANFEKTAQDLFDKQGRRLVHVSTWSDNGKRQWAGISRAGDWANSFWISNDLASFEKKAQDLFDKQGRRLIFVTSYVEGGHRRWLGISRSGDWANSFWVSADSQSFQKEAQDLFDKHGRRLIHVHTFMENGKRHWAGISRGGTWGNSFFIDSDLDTFNRQAQDLFDTKGRRLMAVEFLSE
jgi:hypothetical protein